MKISLALALTLAGPGLVFSALAHADTRYTMQVDGLACAYCAYGIEKNSSKLMG
ncbi:MAG: hypothetical protein ACPHER_10690 [Nevskiales bacterium]